MLVRVDSFVNLWLFAQFCVALTFVDSFGHFDAYDRLRPFDVLTVLNHLFCNHCYKTEIDRRAIALDYKCFVVL